MKKIIGLVLYFVVQVSVFAQNPNIILITTDQHTSSALSSAGNTDLHTPNIDRIAKGGTSFSRAYVTFPLCTPSRGSMFTGKMPHEIGILSNDQVNIPKDTFEKGLGKVVAANGYENVYAGKWHVPEIDIPDNVGFTKLANMGDEGLAESCIDFLNKKHTKPFFMVASFVNPHDICEYARGQRLPNGSIQGNEIHDCPTLPVNHPISAYDPEIIRWEQQADSKIYPSISYTDDDWRKYLDVYYRLIEKVDHEIGKILDAISANGLAEDTVIIFTSDHGDGATAHHWNQKTVLFEESIRVPLIIKDPRVPKSPPQSNQLVSVGLDLMPTIVDLTGSKLPNGLLGQTLAPFLKDGNYRTKHEFLVVQTMFDDNPSALKTKGRSLISERFKYVVYDQGKNREQLFDLEKDPYEMTNLVNVSKYFPELKKAREQLYDWCVKTNDKVVFKRLLVY